MKKYRKYRNITLWGLFIILIVPSGLTFSFLAIFREAFHVTLGDAFLLSWILVLSLLTFNSIVQILILAILVLSVHFHIKYKKHGIVE